MSVSLDLEKRVLIPKEADELRKELKRLKPQLKVFTIVQAGGNPECAFPFYQRYKGALISSGFYRWRDRIKSTLPTRKEQLRTLFERDVESARRISKIGVNINGNTEYLPYFIDQDMAKRRVIKERLATIMRKKP